MYMHTYVYICIYVYIYKYVYICTHIGPVSPENQASSGRNRTFSQGLNP